MSEPFELKAAGGALVFKPLAKTVDQTNADSFLAPMSARAAEGFKLALDLSELRFLNSAGLGAVVMLVRDLKQAGGELRICSPTPTVRALFKMVRLENIAAIDDSVDAALAAFGAEASEGG